LENEAEISHLTLQSSQEYYERDIPLFAIENIYKHQLLTDEIIASLNPDVSFADLKADIENIGYSRTAA